jgi:uncharacterized membrane protein
MLIFVFRLLLSILVRLVRITIMIKSLILLLLTMVIARILLLASRIAGRRFGRNAPPTFIRGKNVVDGNYRVVVDDNESPK